MDDYSQRKTEIFNHLLNITSKDGIFLVSFFVVIGGNK